MTRQELTRLLEEALVEWATERRDARGDSFATASDLENIKGDPLGFADLLKEEDAYAFLKRMLAIQQRREEDAEAARQAEWNRTRTFRTNDGYRLHYAGGAWSDGDLMFADDPVNGWPLDADGNPLQGGFYYP